MFNDLIIALQYLFDLWPILKWSVRVLEIVVTRRRTPSRLVRSSTRREEGQCKKRRDPALTLLRDAAKVALRELLEVLMDQ